MIKFNRYEKAGVPEYWIVEQEAKLVSRVISIPACFVFSDLLSNNEEYVYILGNLS